MTFYEETKGARLGVGVLIVALVVVFVFGVLAMFTFLAGIVIGLTYCGRSR